MKQKFFLFLLLLIFWMVLSPAITLESMIIGILACLFVIFYLQDIVSDLELPVHFFKQFKIFILFMLNLFIEIIKANIEVAKIILTPSLPISPCIIRIPIMLKKSVNQVIFANSVSLIPGTISIDITEKEFIIHALTEKAALDMVNSFIERYLVQMEEAEK